LFRADVPPHEGEGEGTACCIRFAVRRRLWSDGRMRRLGEIKMEDLFHAYWWLLFPLGWFVYAGFASWLNYRRQKDAIEVIKSYAASGKEPPADLLKVLNRSIDADAEFWGATDEARAHRRPHNYWSLFGLFAVLAAGFGFGMVALALGAVAVWAMINAAMSRPRQ